MAEIDDFSNECSCIYKNEKYLVRDNGSILRHSKIESRIRLNDNCWTFGKLNIKSGYFEIASVCVHRIVATAFHGKPPTNEHVVDHIDTNKQNNRPENLRWLTRLENIILNPITAKRIALRCGSVQAFLDDPLKYRGVFPEPNYSWMRSVTLEEAQSSKEKLFIWAKSHKALSGRSLDEWIFSGSSPLTPLEKYSEYTPSPTPRVLQKNWKTPTEFPSCPQDPKITSICAYANKLQLGTIFSINQYSSSIVEDIAISKDKETLWVMCISTASKPYSLAEITIANDHYVHNNLGSFFQKKSAKKYYILAQGLEWEGGETFDDLC